MEYTANHVILRGTLTGLPEFSHENHSRKFYRFSLEVERLSGTTDILPVMAAEDVLEAMDLFCGGRIEVEGQLRSFNSRAASGRRLVISVYASALTTSDDAPENLVELTGTICKEPVFRRTPLGREICDVMLAVNRPYHRTDYLPCILWGRTAQEISQLPVGARIALSGRLQSRDYIKVLPEGNERRTAYEVSVTTAEPCAEEAQALLC